MKQEDGIYHVMSHSLSDHDWFTDDEDKTYYLDLLKYYIEKHQCKIYGYCLMTTHVHLHIDPCGVDISYFMKCFNIAYVHYVNKKYGRRGPLVAERFESKIVDTMSYTLLVSAYIHNNPHVIDGYSGREHEYPFSSLGIYLGKVKDRRDLVDTDFVLKCFNENNKKKAVKEYAEFVVRRRDMALSSDVKKYIEEFNEGKYQFKSYRQIFLRDSSPEAVVDMVAKEFNVTNVAALMTKQVRKNTKFRAVVAYALRVFCGLTLKQICDQLYNISLSACDYLFHKGFDIASVDPQVQGLMHRLKGLKTV